MCSDCEEDEPVCFYCGACCLGECADPDTCATCWRDSHLDIWFVDEDVIDVIDECIRGGCTCKCHHDIWKECGIHYEGGVLFHEDDDPVYKRSGVFKILALALELREKIYGFAFLQEGNQRYGPNHRGSIHTALLQTCRQVYTEAGHLPLTLNQLNFKGPIGAHDFFGFSLAPSIRHLVTSLHIEYHIAEHSAITQVWPLLLRVLTKMPITHLGLTLMGSYPKEALLGHTCFADRYSVLKDLRSVDLVVASSLITTKDKEKIVEDIKCKLIKGYMPSIQKKYSTKESQRIKRTIGSEHNAKPAGKKPKTGTSHHSVRSRTQGRSLKPKEPRRDLALETTERAKARLLGTVERLKQYAISIDPDTTSVKIRLKDARNAAETLDETKFEKLVHGMWATLEDSFAKIDAARKATLFLPASAITAVTEQTPSVMESGQRRLITKDSGC